MIRALIFDFDGLILDTETPEYDEWVAIYRSYGFDLPIETWGKIIGGSYAVAFDPIIDLSEKVGPSLNGPEVREYHRTRSLDRIHKNPVLPGVIECLQDAKRLEMKVGIASSSDRIWVEGHLSRLGLLDQFDVILCADDVVNTKPDPELFLSVAQALDVQPHEAIVFEDSPNGIKAARAAGIFCVAVPNEITGRLDVNGADMVLKTVGDMTLEEIIAIAQG